MLRLRPKWPNAAECCGREVQTNRLGRKRAWWAQGTAIERFEQAIEPEIEAILSNADLEDADIYFRIYMIGKNEEASRPTIMICCADTSVGRRAKESLRDSSIIRNNPGFCLGSIDFPLEQLVPMRELSHEIEYDSVEILSASGSRSTHDVRVFATSKSATIGRRLFIPHPSTMDIQRYSTGGVVVEAHGQFYQLTVGHITGFPDITLRSSSMDPDACSFDGQNDSEAGDDFSISEQDMRRASMSFVDLSDSGSSDAETERSVSNTINSGSPPFTDCMTTNSDTERCFSPRRNEGLLPGHFIKVGTIMSQSKDGDKRSLDYALVSIQPPQENDNINIVVLDPKRDTGILSVHKVAAVTGGERRIITVTGSGGVMKGNLIPGTTFLKRASQRTPQRLHVVQLDGVVAEGDSGAAVLDEVSGNLYGHVVSGCPGTRVAYIVPATELFESLVTQLAGQVSIPSTSELQKWTAEPSSTDRLFEGLGEKQAPGVPHVDRSHHSQVLTRSPPTIDRSTSIATNQHRSKEGPTDVLSLASSPDGQGIGRYLRNTQRDTVKVPPSSWEASGEKAYQATRRSITLPRGKSAAQNVITSDQEHNPDLENPYFLATKISSSSNRGDQVKNGHFRAGGKTRKRILPQRRQIKAQFRDKTRIRARESRSNGEGRGNKQDPHRESYDLSILSLLDENDPFVVEPDDEGSVASLFITGNGLEEGSRFRVELLESFCGSQSLQDFEKSIRMTGSRPTCWIDDRTNDGTKSLPVGECGPLNVRGLYQRLSKKRFFYEIQNTPGSWGITRSSHPEYTPRPSAERRLIFITDIDRHGLTALMATATISQARVLDNVLYKHLAFEADIAASNPSRGWGYCTLYFHLPLYAWRSTPSSIRDSRMRTSGKPFRKVTDVSFLRGKAAPESSREMFDYICQAQVSVLITGIDRCRWTGLCLVDNYFQPQGYREDVNDYHLEEHGILFDPITAGAYCADTPLLDPSEYFLAVLEVRIGRFQQGWQETISSLEMRINEYISLWEPVDFTNHTVSMESYRLKEDLLWVVRAKRLLRTLSHCLRTTIEYRKSFTPTKDAFETPFCHKTLVSIQKVFIDLGVYADRLEAAYTKCDDFSNQLNLYMRCEELRHQMEASKNSRTVSYFLLYILSPVTIAAAMLSMQEKAIPSFLGPSKFSFLILAPVLGLSVYAISACISNWTQIQLFIKHSLGSEKTALDREEITLPV